MIPIPPFAWRAIGALVLAASIFGAGVYWHHKTYYVPMVAEYNQFKGGVEAVGREAFKRAERQTAEDQRSKQRADSENAKSRRDLDALYDAYGRLRDQRANSGGGFLPSAPAGSGSPDVATVDREAVDRALSTFDRGVTGLLKEGDQAIVDLNTAKRHAQDTRRSNAE